MDHRPGQTRREAGTQSQGSSSEDRPVAGVQHSARPFEVNPVKAILARFTLAVSLLATMALTLGAGVKWDWWTEREQRCSHPFPNRSTATRPACGSSLGLSPAGPFAVHVALMKSGPSGPLFSCTSWRA